MKFHVKTIGQAVYFVFVDEFGAEFTGMVSNETANEMGKMLTYASCLHSTQRNYEHVFSFDK